MSVQRSVNWISQQRVDVPDMRSVESAVRNDFDQLITGFLTNTTQGYFVRGFNILMAGAIGGASNGLSVDVDNGAILHIQASQSGTTLNVPAGTPAQILNAATNTNVSGAFAPSAVNYVTIDYIRFIDPATSAQVYIWNPTTNTETTKNAPRASILEYVIHISTQTPTPNLLPIATVITDANNNVVSIQDDRPLLCRLGSGGITPDPFNTYSWPEGRNENPSASTSNSSDPFFGGDKAIDCVKTWMNAVMSAIQEIKGTTYWYSISSSGSLESLREDLANTVITGRGSIAHGVLPSDKTTPTQAGQINWDQDINIKVIGSALTYTLAANPTSTDITLTDDEVAYINLIRNVVVSPNLIFTNGIPQVTSVGAISWTGPLQAGDYLKMASNTSSGFYEIQSVDSLTQVTLTTNFAGTSSGPSGAKGAYSFGTYVTSPTPSTSRDIFITTRELVPEGQNIFWLFMRTDNGGAQPRVYIRFLGVELDQGEDRDISDTTSAELLKYIGSATASTYAPQYVSALTPGSVPEIQTLTFGTAAQTPQNSYFFINSSGNTRQYYAWFNKDGAGVDPNPGASNASIEIDISTGMTNAQIASAASAALASTFFNDFRTTLSTNQVTVTNTSAGSCQAAVDGTVGSPFAVVVNQVGTGTGNHYIKDGDNLTLAIKELDDAIGSIQAALDEASYDESILVVSSGATPPNTVNGPVSPGTTLFLPNNSRLGNVVQNYTVGKAVLQVYLNGQYLLNGTDWTENGPNGSVSNSFTIQIPVAVTDELNVRISVGGGGGGGGGGVGPPGPPGPSGPPGADAAGGPINISTKTSNYTVSLSDCFLRANCTSGVVTFTLPPAASAIGRIFYVKKIDSSANAMAITANGSELIDGFNSFTTVIQYEAFSLISNGASWDIF